MKVMKILLVLVLGLVLFGCASKPNTFIVTHDQAATWRAVDIRQDLKGENDKVWEMLIDTIAQKYDLETINKESGYLRTSWKYTYMVGIVSKQISNRYRTRIVMKVNQDFSQLKVKCESNWLHKRGWIQGYDTLLLEDIYSDIQGKVGRVITR